MDLITNKADLQTWVNAKGGRYRALVPTMGALHRGHTSLFDLARLHADEKAGDVLATIFVNPTQFGPSEDYDAYPRPLEEDLKECRQHGVDAVFAPVASDMYAPNRSITITESNLTRGLCGASRPGHFDGVCTVVAKLFLLTRADVAVFGEKDYQQLAVIRRMVRDLDFPIEIIGAPTVRESDGLALSSRNAYLSSAERAQAPILHRALQVTAEAIRERRVKTAQEARLYFEEAFSVASLARLDYFDIVEASTLQSLSGEISLAAEATRLLAAAFYGKTRLIDNCAGLRGN